MPSAPPRPERFSRARGGRRGSSHTFVAKASAWTSPLAAGRVSTRLAPRTSALSPAGRPVAVRCRWALDAGRRDADGGLRRRRLQHRGPKVPPARRSPAGVIAQQRGPSAQQFHRQRSGCPEKRRRMMPAEFGKLGVAALHCSRTMHNPPTGLRAEVPIGIKEPAGHQRAGPPGADGEINHGRVGRGQPPQVFDARFVQLAPQPEQSHPRPAS